MIQSYIKRVTDGDDLSTRDAADAATLVFEEATEAQIGALLAALRAKGETETEIAGFATGMREAARTISPATEPLVDTCGTGGDGHDTINVSTTSAFVVAGAGIPVAKHGNYSVSSASGSADVLEKIGVTIDAEPSQVEACIEQHDIGFMLAPVFHPAMKAVIGPRKELEMRTIFNVLGPLTNPAGATSQVIGVYDPDLVPVLANALAHMETERALVVHGAGLDEIAVHDATTVAEVDGSTVTNYTVTPDDLGVSTHDLTAIAGGTPEENAQRMQDILAGEGPAAHQDIILANAGAAIYIGGGAGSLRAGVDRARESITSGAAATKLAALSEFDP